MRNCTNSAPVIYNRCPLTPPTGKGVMCEAMNDLLNASAVPGSSSFEIRDLWIERGCVHQQVLAVLGF